MLQVEIKGKTFEFEGINGELDNRGYINSTEFYNKQSSLIVIFSELGDTPVDMYHSNFMKILFDHIVENVEQGIEELVISLDSILLQVTGEGENYEIHIEETRSLYEPARFITYFKLFTIIDFLLIPLHSVRTGDTQTEVLYGNKVMFGIAPKLKRLPPFVSERVVVGQIEKASDKQVLGYKYLSMEDLLKYDVELTYINYRG